MKTLTAIILPNRYKKSTSAIREDRIVDAFGIAQEKNKRNLLLSAENAIKQQCNDLGIESEIRSGNTPLSKVTTDLVLIIDEKAYLENDYLEKALSLSSLFPLATLCGPVINKCSFTTPEWFTEDLLRSYKSYIVDMYNCHTLNITEDKNYWPRLNNVVITGKTFNDVGGYIYKENPKLGKVYKNGSILSELSKADDIIYSSVLKSHYVFSEEEFTHNAMCMYFYEMGYLDSIIHDENVDDVVWQKYVNNSERFDYSLPIWVAMNESIPDEDKKKEYARKLVVFKTLYNLGFSEGIEGGSII